MENGKWATNPSYLLGLHDDSRERNVISFMWSYKYYLINFNGIGQMKQYTLILECFLALWSSRSTVQNPNPVDVNILMNIYMWSLRLPTALMILGRLGTLISCSKYCNCTNIPKKKSKKKKHCNYMGPMNISNGSQSVTNSTLLIKWTTSFPIYIWA